MIRSRVSGRVTVHAGPRAELAALALEYAAGDHGPLVDALPCHFERAAADLLNGGTSVSAGRIEFWNDRPDGAPFHGPYLMRPDPDPVWLAAHPEYCCQAPAVFG